MTKGQLAELLDGREYCSEMTESEEQLAKDEGLLVIFGASDDLMEFRGVIYDEAGVCDGGIVRIKDGKILELPDRDESEVLKKYGVYDQVVSGGFAVEALWCEEDGYSWTYKTDVPHATFEITDGDEAYCRGIVIDMTEVA